MDASADCPPIHYAVAASAVDDGPFSELRTALDEITEIAGTRFVFDGSPSIGTTTKRSRLVVEWFPFSEKYGPSAPAEWLGHASGVVLTAHPEGTTALISLNADAPLARGMGAGSWGVVIRHELGHVLGLDHSGDPRDVMHPEIGAGGWWSDREMDELRWRGTLSGCERSNPSASASAAQPG